MKKFFAILMSLTLMLSLAVPAMAGDVVNSTGRKYKAYQIFSGTQADGDKVLGDIAWGDGINGDDFLSALKVDSKFGEGDANRFAKCKTALDVANALEDVADQSDIAKAFANLAEKHIKGNGADVEANETAQLAAGYYLLIDQSDVSSGHVAKNPALLQVTNDNELNIIDKSGVPTVNKTIQGEGEAAEGSIGDTFTFVLTATMPSTFEGYDSYKVVFHDTLSKGLTLDESSIHVDVEGFTAVVTKDGDDTIITITNNNVLAQNVTAGSTITVTYTATLDADAAIGAAGNPNTVKLEYSNDPDWEGTAGSSGEPTGETPEDKVVVYTFELDVTKVDGNDITKKLDAEFVLYRNVEKTVPDADGQQGTTETVTEYVQVDTSGRVTGWTTTKPEPGNLKTGEDGFVQITGLDAGTYYLEETKAPAGYNILTAPITVVITATVTDSEEVQALTALTITADAEAGTSDANTGVVGTTVVNNAGATLPETGGIGTTIFYIVGGVMVAAAVVLLVTKKRMSAEG